MIFFDTETCGLHGPIVLLQYAVDDGPIHLHSVWTEPIRSTMSLIESFCQDPDGVVGFNLAFDWFHLCQLYTTLALMPDQDAEPQNCVEQYAEFEPLGRDGPCLKPARACDIMLHARKGPYQSTMDRGDIRIRRVPTALAWHLAGELEKRIKLKDIYFARRRDKHAAKWQIYDIKDDEGEVDPDFKDVVLKFAPSSALKALATDALELPIDTVLMFTDVEMSHKLYPVELGYAPFAKAIGDRHNWRGAWPDMIRHHISHWAYGTLARKYASDDVKYTRDLYRHFGSPEPGDDDSELACMVAAVRWRGFRVDVSGLRELRVKALKRRERSDGFKIPVAPAQARYYVKEFMDETELLGASLQQASDLEVTTKKIVLEKIATWKRDCPECRIVDGDLSKEPTCICKGRGLIDHPAAVRAREVLDARQANYEADFYEKLITAGRFHASLSVIGALSSRMGGGGSSAGIESSGFAGGDGLNAQGVKKTKEVRSKFPLAWDREYVLPDGQIQPAMTLCGGDFDGFEVTIAVAVYNDDRLRQMLLTCEKCEGAMAYSEERNDLICGKCGSNKGKKIHALFGLHCFPEETYESLKATSGTADDKYTRAKSGVFALMYGGTEHTLADRLGVPVEVGLKALASFHREFPGVRRFQQDIFNSFCSMRQPGGIGSKVEWHEPAEFRETMFGFRRYFTLENQISRVLFELANAPPKGWREMRLRVERRAGRVQTAGGAVQSALYGGAFQIQAGAMRAAANHDIQSSGATVTKLVQRRLWDVQPPGIGPWLVQPLNIHDEIECPCVPSVAGRVKEVVQTVVKEVRAKVPLIKMDWGIGLKTWADKS